MAVRTVYKTVYKESGWAEFGQAAACIIGVLVSAFVLYLLLVAPYERHKDVVQKLDNLERLMYLSHNR